MRPLNKQQPGALAELVGAIKDSFNHNSTERLRRLEERLAQLSRWIVLAVILAFAYFAYHLWGEMRAELSDYLVAREYNGAVATNGAGDEARSSIFLIFAVALGGPIALFVGYLILGFIYNVCHDTLVRWIPLARFMIVPALLIVALMMVTSRREELKQTLFDGYEVVAQHLDSAKSLRQQAKAAAAALRELRQIETQGYVGDGEPAVVGAGSTPKSGGVESQAVSQEEAVRRLGEMMLQLQGLPVPTQQQLKAAEELPVTPETSEQEPPAAVTTSTPSPAAPADI